jgi:hypothetical protein
MKFPIRLYDSDKRIIKKSWNTQSNCIYFYSYQTITVTITSGTGVLYSVLNNSGTLTTNTGQTFSDNFGYTLYIPENLTSVIVKVSNSSGESEEYTFTLKLDNIISEEYGNLHYNDLLVNNNLPDYTELIKAIPDEFSSGNLIKRLLLDFKKIMQRKGTKQCIDDFLELIGFDDENLTVYDIYYNRANQTYSTSPNKATDLKTGDYACIYDNFTDDGLDDNNMPIAKTIIKDLDSFAEHLLYAISLANTYFTAEEQEITQFLLNYSSNIAIEPSVTSYMNQIFEHDVFYFRRNLKINILNYFDSDDIINLVVNNTQKEDTIYRSEIKTYLEDESSKNNDEIYLIDREIFDDETIGTETDQTKIYKAFASCIHLNIVSPNTYVYYTVENPNNPLNILTSDTVFLTGTETLSGIVVISETATYVVSVYVTDIYNNTEKYFYNVIVDTSIQRIDFDSFDSVKVADDANDFTIDIDSPSKLSSKESDTSINYILPLDTIPDDLSNYFGIAGQSSYNWLTDTSQFVIDNMNGNDILDDISETIPLELTECWLSILSIKYDSDYTLKIRVINPVDMTTNIIDIADLNSYDSVLDMICVMLVDIYDRNSSDEIDTTEDKVPYYLITSTEPGIDFTIENYDFVLVHNTSGAIKSIYDLTLNTDYFTKKIPVNYDFPLFKIYSDLVTTFVPYISDNSNVTKITINSVEYVLIKSLFNRLTNIEYCDGYYLKLGDVFVCRMNENYIVNETKVNWKVINSFTQEILFETTDLVLKYRIAEITCYDIICSFVIDSTTYTITKSSLFSSYLIE